jgi:hypothetical protein
MQFELFLPKSFTEKEERLLHEKGVDLDDWDYSLLTYNIELFREVIGTKFKWDDKKSEYVSMPHKTFFPNEYVIENLLRGCSDNVWYYINWNGKKAFMGFAYHG